jgi:DNA-binding transcriptional MerR regulator
MLPDGTKVEPRRTAGGYRRFTPAMLEEIALSSYRNHWFSMGHLKSTYRELLVAAHRETGEYKILS